MGGLVNVFWMSNQRNRDLFHSSGIELEYANLSCTHTNGSMDQVPKFPTIVCYTSLAIVEP